MFEIVGLFLFGLVVGGYGTLVGIGGGPLIVPMVAIFYRYDPPTVIAVSVLVIFCNTLSGTLAYVKERRIDLVSGTKFGLAAIPGALISILAIYHIRLNAFSFLFGFFLLLLALYIFFHPVAKEFAWADSPLLGGKSRPKARSGSRLSLDDEIYEDVQPAGPRLAGRVIEDASGNKYVYQVNESLGIWVTALIGACSTFLGIGGGLIQVPVLVYLLNFPVHVATATSHYITAINAGFTLIPLLVNGSIPYKVALCMSAGAIIGAQFGAKLSGRVSGKGLLKLLIPVFLLMGIKLMFFNY